MGISRGGARLIMEEARFWPFQGKLLQLGRQHTFFGADEFDETHGQVAAQHDGLQPVLGEQCPRLLVADGEAGRPDIAVEEAVAGGAFDQHGFGVEALGLPGSGGRHALSGTKHKARGAEAAVDVECMPVHVARFVGAQEHRSVRDLLGRAVAGHGDEIVVGCPRRLIVGESG